LEHEAKFDSWFENDAKKYAQWIFKQRYPIKANQSFVGVGLIELVPVETIQYLCDHSG
ncbi:hypothetical protein K501DRAFT_138534, partial [Backusella circina FSU 941]